MASCNILLIRALEICEHEQIVRRIEMLFELQKWLFLDFINQNLPMLWSFNLITKNSKYLMSPELGIIFGWVQILGKALRLADPWKNKANVLDFWSH